MKENRIILERPLGFLIILANSTSKSNKNKEVKASGETKSLSCPDEDCKGWLRLDKESGFHRCFKCGKYWKYTGKGRTIIISKAPKPRERRIQEEDSAR